MSTARAKKAVTIFVSILVVSTGLCGAQILAIPHLHFFSIGGGPSPGPHGDLKDNISIGLIDLGLLEVAGMIIGAIGTVVSLVAWMAAAVGRPVESGNERQQ